MRAATASGTLISALLWTFVSAVPGLATAEKIASQERVCQDVARPGTRIMDRVCGTSAEMRAYVRQDFYAKSFRTHCSKVHPADSRFAGCF